MPSIDPLPDLPPLSPPVLVYGAETINREISPPLPSRGAETGVPLGGICTGTRGQSDGMGAGLYCVRTLERFDGEDVEERDARDGRVIDGNARESVWLGWEMRRLLEGSNQDERSGGGRSFAGPPEIVSLHIGDDEIEPCALPQGRASSWRLEGRA